MQKDGDQAARPFPASFEFPIMAPTVPKRRSGLLKNSCSRTKHPHVIRTPRMEAM